MSLRMHLMGALMRPVVRRALFRADDPLRMRRMFARLAEVQFRNVPGADFRAATYTSMDQRPVLWVTGGVPRNPGVILYLHGGGYTAGSPATHRRLIARLCRSSGFRAFVPAYRLAPEHPLPAALDDAVAAHAHLLAMGYRPEDIIIGGDSAGGGLALALLAHLCTNLQPPAACFAWSPFCDQTFSGKSIHDNADSDHFFPKGRTSVLADIILGSTDPRDPRVSPLFAGFPNCPPVLLQVSNSEILQDDAFRMEEKLRQGGAEVILQSWDNAPHVWQLFDGWFPEAREAIELTADFINSHARQPDDS